MPRPILDAEIRASLARQRFDDAVNVRHVEGWLYQTFNPVTDLLNPAGSSVTQYETPQFDRAVRFSVLITRAVPHLESESIAQRWQL